MHALHGVKERLRREEQVDRAVVCQIHGRVDLAGVAIPLRDERLVVLNRLDDAVYMLQAQSKIVVLYFEHAFEGRRLLHLCHRSLKESFVFEKTLGYNAL